MQQPKIDAVFGRGKRQRKKSEQINYNEQTDPGQDPLREGLLSAQEVRYLVPAKCT